jgi:L-lactate dehydrogenase complex protein LldG
MTDTLGQFESSLREAVVDVRRTTADQFRTVLDDVVDPPAVGVPLPFEDVTLSGAGVELDPDAAEVSEAVTGVTPATLGIADYGSLVIESTAAGEEHASLFPLRHVAVVAASAVVPDMAAAFAVLGDRVRDGRDDVVIATGPSATADMGDLVLGAHGPREVTAVILEDR